VTVRAVVIGRGLAGRVFHAPLIEAVPALELVRMAGAADAEAAAIRRDVDLVVIATPNSSHFPLARFRRGGAGCRRDLGCGLGRWNGSGEAVARTN
jgi:hypothetical protein